MQGIQKKFKRKAELRGITTCGDRKVSVQNLVTISDIERLSLSHDLQSLYSSEINILK